MVTRKWLLIVAAVFAAASMLVSARDLLANSHWNAGAFEGSLAVICAILIGWDGDAPANRTTVKVLSVAAIVVSLLLLLMLVALPGNLTVRLLLTGAAVIVFGAAIWQIARA